MKDTTRWIRLALIASIDAEQKLMTVDGMLGNEKFQFGKEEDVLEALNDVIEIQKETELLQKKLYKILSRKESEEEELA